MKDLERKVNMIRREVKDATDLHVRSEERLSAFDRESDRIYNEIKTNIGFDVRNLEDAEGKHLELGEEMNTIADKMVEILKKEGRNI